MEKEYRFLIIWKDLEGNCKQGTVHTNYMGDFLGSGLYANKEKMRLFKLSINTQTREKKQGKCSTEALKKKGRRENEERNVY